MEEDSCVFDEKFLGYKYLLEGADPLLYPDYRKMQWNAGRNDELLYAVLCAYAKHVLDFYGIGWNELGDILMDAICEEIGVTAFDMWCDRIKSFM